MMRRGMGHGKLILFGEHAAVYGHPAIGTALDCRTELTWDIPTGLPGDGAETPRTPDETGKDRRIFLDLLNKARDSGWNMKSGGTWRRRGDVPRAGGFGSSAALCVAVARIALDKPESGYDRDVHRFANDLETLFHGNPSGIDTGMASDSGPSEWTAVENDVPLRNPVTIPDWHLVYGALPRSGSTAESVGRLGGMRSSGDAAVTRGLDNLGRISEAFSGLSESPEKDFPRVAADLVNQAQSILASLGLSVPELDEILEIGIRSGALGGKLSGGGQGGAFYLCFPDAGTRDINMNRLKETIRSRGIRLIVPLTKLSLGNLHRDD